MGKPAARLTDMHVCPMVNPGPVPHVGGPIVGPGCPTVLIGGLPAARMGDKCLCTGPPDTIVLGSTGVFIGGKPAARMGDQCAHGGKIVKGAFSVLIGEASAGCAGGLGMMPIEVLKSVMRDVPADVALKLAHVVSLRQAAIDGTPFCEKCVAAIKPAPKKDITVAPVVNFQSDDGIHKTNQPAPVLDEVTITCSHGRICAADAPFFELVPTAGASLPYTDRTTIAWTGPNKPASIAVTNLGVIKGAGTYELPFNFEREKEEQEWRTKTSDDLQRGTSGLVMAAGRTLYELGREIFTYNHCKTYGIGGLPGRSLPVKVYNPERWTLTINFPKLKSFKGGVKLEKELGADKVTISTSSSRSTSVLGDNKSANLGSNLYFEKKEESKVTIEKKGGDFFVDVKADEPTVKNTTSRTGDYITLTRDGSPFKFDALNSISAYLKIVDSIYYIIEMIRDVNNKIPKAGLSFDFDVQVMNGDFSIEWGWKEYEDHRAYYNIKPAINATILSASLELAFGVSCPGFKAQAYVSGGVEVPVAIEFENKTPGNFWQTEIETAGKIAVVASFTIGAKVEIGYFFEINPLVTTGISLNGGISASSELSISAAISFTGVKAQLKHSVGKGGGYAMEESYNRNYSASNAGSEGTVKVLVEGYDWGTWKFPDEPQPVTDIDEAGFATIIEDMLSGKTNRNAPLEFFREKDETEKSFWTSDYEEIPISTVAKRIARKGSGKPLRRTHNSLTAIANEIRVELQIIESKGWLKDDFVAGHELNWFIDGGPLAIIFNRNLDPRNEIYNQQT